MDFSQIMRPCDAQWAYTYHFYPGVWDDTLLHPSLDSIMRREAFARALDEILASMQDYHGPLLCGEIGYELARLEDAFGIQLTADTIRVLEDRVSGWCLWCYKDARFMGLRYPAEDCGWMKLVHQVAKQWNHHRATRIGTEAVNAIDSLCVYSLSDEEKYRMQFIVRAALAHTDGTHILEPLLQAMPKHENDHLAEDFIFSKCAVNIALETLLRKSCQKNTIS